jgi:hypothetical protein
VQRLHLVGFTSELDGLIFSAKTGARSGGYVVALDGELLDAIREVLERRDRHRAPAPTVSFPSARPLQGSSLSPREIQARLRAGRHIEDVALEAGVDDEWVRRFATPVFAERAHVAGRAQAGVLELDELGPSSESLGRAVAANLADRGDPLTPGELDDGWDAYQLRESAWVVEFRAPLQAPEQAARWGFDTRSARLTALNPKAAELGWVGADGRGASPGPTLDASGPVAGNGATPAAHVPEEQLPLEVAVRPARRARAAQGADAPRAPTARRPGVRNRRSTARNGAGGRAETEE